MDADQIRRLKPELTRYLKRLGDCFMRRDTRMHFPVYIQGQLSELPAKSCEPIALAAGMAPQTLQAFLAYYRWDEDRMRDRLQQIVMGEHAGPNSIGVIDETSDVKKGDKTPGVQRQWCGAVGKKENCMVTVHLGYARGDFHCLVDGDLFLPERWSQDRSRCRAAGIPEEVVYRPKWQIALALYDRATEKAMHFDWLTFEFPVLTDLQILEVIGHAVAGVFLEVADKADLADAMPGVLSMIEAVEQHLVGDLVPCPAAQDRPHVHRRGGVGAQPVGVGPMTAVLFIGRGRVEACDEQPLARRSTIAQAVGPGLRFRGILGAGFAEQSEHSGYPPGGTSLVTRTPSPLRLAVLDCR